ncbi:helix-turn-helix domain-containing protein [Sphingobacterium paucimobilis]|uniref:Helix-turn-helix domain-containing protein n=1 Tax=Sphingobacterium paucimobilis HER1398 TaxID=1346330 RepID=U2HQE9_9SPHI|nr:helix-turn-helix domain-containing protein [Sphingobacterium paucimobilis]ERJ57692.1 hypothetical protein M472_02825 [Sphingobacterium paucimobilis HER1398]
MENKDFKARQEAAWARYAELSPELYIPFIIGQIDQLMDIFISCQASQAECLAGMQLLIERSLSGKAAAPRVEHATVPTQKDDVLVPDKRRLIHIHDLVLAEGDWLMDTSEALDILKISRGTLVSHRDEGLLTEVRIGKKGGGVRFISSEVAHLREWYSVRKGKV